jgi:hypothetical protein
VKLVHLVGFIIKEICYDAARSHESKLRAEVGQETLEEMKNKAGGGQRRSRMGRKRKKYKEKT